MKNFLNTFLLTTLLTAPVGLAQAHETGDIFLRLGAAQVDPTNDDSSLVAGIGGSGVRVDDDTQLGITVTYMLSNRLGLELLAATPFEHEVNASGSIAGLGEVATVKQLPPTLTLIYYPLNPSSKVQPFFGAGINYTTFFDADASASAEAALNGGADTDVDVDDSWGLALRAGVDVKLNDKWNLNAGVWYLDIDTTATYETSGGDVDVDIDIDPYVYMLGVSYTF